MIIVGLIILLSTGSVWPFPRGATRSLLQTDEIRPAPASIGADIPLTYFGPPPSSVQKELIGPYQLLKSGTVDLENGTVTLPLYRGSTPSQRVNYWYVVTDSSDQGSAASLGLNYSPKIGYVAGLKDTTGYRTGVLDADALLETNRGWVEFARARNVVPGAAPNLFPPTTAVPGSRSRNGYTPIVVVANVVYNAPIVAGNVSADVLKQYCNGISDDKKAAAYAVLHDKVLSICPNEDGTGGTVTLQLTTGFSFARPVLYLSLDASGELPAAMEAVTFAPAINRLNVAKDDSLFSPVERIFATVNGYTNADRPANMPQNKNHPSRQGFNSALRGEGGPLNILGGIPTVATDYSPFWDLNIGEWTPAAVAAGYRVRLLEEFQILGMVNQGYYTGPGNTTYGSSGFIINCPIVQRFL